MNNNNWNRFFYISFLLDLILVWGVLAIEGVCANRAVEVLLSVSLVLVLMLRGFYTAQQSASVWTKGRELALGTGAMALLQCSFALFGLSSGGIRGGVDCFLLTWGLLWGRYCVSDQLAEFLRSWAPEHHRRMEGICEPRTDGVPRWKKEGKGSRATAEKPRRGCGSALTTGAGQAVSGTGIPAWMTLLQQGLIFLLVIIFLLRLALPKDIARSILPFFRWVGLTSGVLTLYCWVRRRNLELTVLGLNFLWLLLTRFTLGELPARFFGVCWWGLVFCSFYSAGYHLGGRQRRSLFKAITLVNAVFFLILGLAGIWVASGGVISPEYALLKENVQLTYEGANDALMYYITFLKNHRNTISPLFFLVMGMLYCQFLSSKRRWKWALVIVLPALYGAIALMHCRSTYLITALCISLCLGILVYRKMRSRKLLAALFAAGAVSLAVCVALFSGFSSVSDLVFEMNDQVTMESTAVPWIPSNAEAIQAAQEKKAAEEQAASEAREGSEEAVQSALPSADAAEGQGAEQNQAQGADPRSTLQDSLTLTSRTDIWATVIPAIEEQHLIALEGQQEGKMMAIIDRLSGLEPKSHMHHVLFQQLMICGIPGFLLYFIFLLSLFLRVVKCCLDPEQPLQLQVLGILLLGVMIYGCFEPLLHWCTGYTSVLFLFLSGCFSGEYEHGQLSREGARRKYVI